jgi:hypothetical protein
MQDVQEHLLHGSICCIALLLFGACKRVGGSGWRFAFDESDVLDGHSETLKVGSGDVEIDLIASVMNFADLVDLRTVGLHLVAHLGDWR